MTDLTNGTGYETAKMTGFWINYRGHGYGPFETKTKAADFALNRHSMQGEMVPTFILFSGSVTVDYMDEIVDITIENFYNLKGSNERDTL